MFTFLKKCKKRKKGFICCFDDLTRNVQETFENVSVKHQHQISLNPSVFLNDCSVNLG